MSRVRAALAALLTSAIVFPLTAQQMDPPGGSLVIVGGAMRDTAIVRRFLDLAGGPDAPIVLIPTAGGADSYDQAWEGGRLFRALGATRLTVLHTYDRGEADTEAFAAPLRDARGVWFGGGRQWRLADSYLGTRVHQELRAILARGGVVGGSSAGATILGSYLARGDTRDNTTMMGDHTEGLGFLTSVAIDQHLLRRNRQFDLLEIVEARPDLLGIGIDENTAIVVQGEEFEVIGESYAVIYDAQRRIGERGGFAFLAPGDRFQLRTRTASRPRDQGDPLQRYQRIEDKP